MRRLALLLASLTILLFAGCAQIAGIEERDFVPTDGGMSDSSVSVLDAAMGDGAFSGDGSSLDGGGEISCAYYCALAKDRCKVEQKVQLFSSDDRCMAVCEAYPKGDRSNPTGNTLACRITQLEKLPVGDMLEPSTYCPGAGPGGSAPQGEGANAACGSNCAGFCRLRQVVCPGEQAETECLRKCQALPDIGTYNAGADFGGGADNIQCRLAHLSAAADYGRQATLTNNMMLLMDRDNHCSHSNIKSSQQCDLKTDMAPNCDDFCKLVQTACVAPGQKVYDDAAQCVRVCQNLAAGTRATIMENNVRCRRERAYEALQIQPSPVVCEASGPAPPLCGLGKCANYCELARAACQAKFDAKYPGADAAESLGKCRAECGTFPDIVQASFYSVLPAPTGDTFNCRLRNAAIAFGDARACDSAIGLPTGVCKN